jgi:hypothetical protein
MTANMNLELCKELLILPLKELKYQLGACGSMRNVGVLQVCSEIGQQLLEIWTLEQINCLRAFTISNTRALYQTRPYLMVDHKEA